MATEKEYYQKQLIPGDNISIIGSTISATGSNYIAGDNINIDNDVISAVDTTYTNFTGASATLAGVAGLVPPPTPADLNSFLCGNGTWSTVSSGTGNVVDVYENGVSVLDENNIAQTHSYKEITQAEYDALYPPGSTVTDNILYAIKDGEGGSGSGGGGGTFIETNSADYENLTPAEKTDASKLYFLKDSGAIEVDTDVVVGSYRNFSEGSVAISTNSSGQLTYTWGGGSSIGAESVYQVPIPADVQKIKFKISTGSAYSATSPAWQVCVGIKDHLDLNNWAYPTDSDFLAKKIFATTSSVFEDEIDCSNITTDSYLYVVAHGWTMTVDYMRLTTEQDVFSTKMMYKNSPYASVKGMESDNYDALSQSEKQNGTVYFVTPSDTGSNKVYFMGDEYGGSAGGGSYSETVLFNGYGSAAPSSMTLSDDYTNYDEIVFCLLRSADSRMYKYHRVFLVSDLNINDSIQMQTYSEYWGIEITSATVFTTISESGMYIDKIVGIKH